MTEHNNNNNNNNNNNYYYYIITDVLRASLHLICFYHPFGKHFLIWFNYFTTFLQVLLVFIAPLNSYYFSLASYYYQCTLQPISEHYFHNSLHMKWSCFLPVAKTENHQNSFPALVEAARNCKVAGLTHNWVIRIVHSFNTSGHNTALRRLSVY